MSLFSIENQGANTYLIYKIDPADEIDSLSLGMIENNKIKGVAQIVFTQMNEDKFMKYNISAKVSANQIFSGTVSKKRMLGILSGIMAAFISAEEYMIDTSLFLLDLDCIFVDVSNCEISLICLPVINREKSTGDLQSFFKSIVFSAKYDQTENCDYVAKIINYLNSTEAFSVSDFKKLVDGLNMESSLKSAPSTDMPVQARERSIPQQPTKIVRESVVSNSQSFSEAAPKPNNISVPQSMDFEKGGNNQPIRKENKVNIPQTKNHSSNKGTDKKTNKTDEKISLMYVLRHYSKENLELYKAQKSSEPSDKERKAGKGKEEKKQPARNKSKVDFAVPGFGTQLPSQNKITENNVAKPETSTALSGNSAIYGSKVNVTNANFGETTVLNVSKNTAAGETTVLGVSANPIVYPKLRRIKTNDIIEINKPRFRIGKEKSYVDYFISDNTAISRSHADIVTNGKECYIVDMNSTNHTYVNGAMIHSGVEVKLESGSSVKLANEEFEFIGV